MLLRYNGYDVFLNDQLVDTVEDWSGVRSPGRARRRRLQGHPQRIVVTGKPKTDIYVFGGRMVMHPAVWDQIKKEMK